MCARDQCSIFSTSGKFHPEYGLLLELYALTLVTRSYALLLHVYIVSYPDHTLSQGKGSGGYWVLSWLCQVSSLDSEHPNEIARHTSIDTSQWNSDARTSSNIKYQDCWLGKPRNHLIVTRPFPSRVGVVCMGTRLTYIPSSPLLLPSLFLPSPPLPPPPCLISVSL